MIIDDEISYHMSKIMVIYILKVTTTKIAQIKEEPALLEFEVSTTELATEYTGFQAFLTSYFVLPTD